MSDQGLKIRTEHRLEIIMNTIFTLCVYWIFSNVDIMVYRFTINCIVNELEDDAGIIEYRVETGSVVIMFFLSFCGP